MSFTKQKLCFIVYFRINHRPGTMGQAFTIRYVRSHSSTFVIHTIGRLVITQTNSCKSSVSRRHIHAVSRIIRIAACPCQSYHNHTADSSPCLCSTFEKHVIPSTVVNSTAPFHFYVRL